MVAIEESGWMQREGLNEESGWMQRKGLNEESEGMQGNEWMKNWPMNTKMRGKFKNWDEFKWANDGRDNKWWEEWGMKKIMNLKDHE